ncbi:hypothetical protein V2J09_010432 [Rumex salicifolius]
MADDNAQALANGGIKRRTLEADSRDAYGFTIRPQHLKIYQEYGGIYTVEEQERSTRWRNFLEQCEGSAELFSSTGESSKTSDAESVKQKIQFTECYRKEYDSSVRQRFSMDSVGDGYEKEEASVANGAGDHKFQLWIPIRPSLAPIDKTMGHRVNKKVTIKDDYNSHNSTAENLKQSDLLDESYKSKMEPFCSNEHDDLSKIVFEEVEIGGVRSNATSNSSFLWKELESLVRGGVPKSLRGEVWQAFTGVTTRRVDRYYQNLISSEMEDGHDVGEPDDCTKSLSRNGPVVPEKLKKQIEKDLCRTFPGHPALDESGRNSLRRVLTAYARYNPSVGYCQAMNFFAGLFLLLMPEENAFWTLVGVIDDYFDGYYTYDMIESQVDQLVFEELIRETFPKLVNHLDYLGVQVTWISSPWFLSIFMNMLPWESVLRVWDVLLFEGNRVMLFRTALALMELYGPSLTTSNDAGDAITLLQSLAGSTFDSSQLVITACMGFLTVTEAKLQKLRNKHRPSVLRIIEETRTGNKVSKVSKKIATKLYSFKRAPPGGMKETKGGGRSTESGVSEALSSDSCTTTDPEEDSAPDLEEQVIWLKLEMCNLLEEKRVASLRAEELETALMEMVKEDNRRLLSARVEQLEQEVTHLQQTLADKQQQEKAMLQVLMHMEQEQKVTEDARFAAEREAANQRDTTQLYQEKYEKAVLELAQMEERVIMAESMLEATMQYESSHPRASETPCAVQQDSPSLASLSPFSRKPGILTFGMNWLDKNKAKSSNSEDSGSSRSAEFAEL